MCSFTRAFQRALRRPTTTSQIAFGFVTISRPGKSHKWVRTRTFAAHLNHVFDSRWAESHVLGQGAYATVYRSDRFPYACNLLDLFLAIRADLPREIQTETGLGEGILESSETKLEKISVACKLLKSDSELRQKAEAKRRKQSKKSGKSDKSQGEVAAKVICVQNGNALPLYMILWFPQVKREMQLQHKHLVAELQVCWSNETSH